MCSSWMLQYAGFLWRGAAITPSAEAGVLRGVPSAWLGSGPAVGGLCMFTGQQNVTKASNSHQAPGHPSHLTNVHLLESVLGHDARTVFSVMIPLWKQRHLVSRNLLL